MGATSGHYQGALTGNLITIEIAGQPIGLIQSLQVQEDFGLQPVSGIGQVIPVEHTPSIARINLTCETIYISLNSALSAGAELSVPQPSASDPPAGLVKNPETLETLEIVPPSPIDILRGSTFTIRVKRIGGKTIRRYDYCSYAGGSISFQKHQIVMQNAQFMAITYVTKE